MFPVNWFAARDENVIFIRNCTVPVDLKFNSSFLNCRNTVHAVHLFKLVSSQRQFLVSIVLEGASIISWWLLSFFILAWIMAALVSWLVAWWPRAWAAAGPSMRLTMPMSARIVAFAWASATAAVTVSSLRSGVVLAWPITRWGVSSILSRKGRHFISNN